MGNSKMILMVVGALAAIGGVLSFLPATTLGPLAPSAQPMLYGVVHLVVGLYALYVAMRE